MAPPSDLADLRQAWSALDGQPGDAGWRTIAVCADAPCSLRAGRQLPTNEEALLIELGTATAPPATRLPQGRGFAVSSTLVGASRFIAIIRRPGGSLDLFGQLAEDLVATVRRQGPASPNVRMRVLLERLHAWQMFMNREGALGAESEVGLFGELEVLAAILASGASGLTACEAWVGPLDELHDFRWATGAIEVKATTVAGHFPARIGSLDQLDESKNSPLFLVGVRLGLADGGRTLAEQIARVRSLLTGQAEAATVIDNRLLAAGYLDAQADRYVKRYRLDSLRAWRIAPTFPRLTRGHVPAAITEVGYVLSLDQVVEPTLPLAECLQHLGVI